MSRAYIDLYTYHSRRKSGLPAFLLRPYLRVFGFPYLSDRWRHRAALAALEGTPLRNARVLDAGCGMGWFSLLLARDHEASVTGVDVDPEWTCKAAELADSSGYTVTFENKDLLDIGVEYAGHFDGVVALDLLEHVEEDQKLLNVFASVSRPGAFLVLAVPTLGRRVVEERERGFGHVRKGYEETALREMLASAGYEVERVRYADPWDTVYWSFRVPGLVSYLLFPFLYLLLLLTSRESTRWGGVMLVTARTKKEGGSP